MSAVRRPETRKRRRQMHWAAYLWPGLPHLWIAGSWAGLALAIGFAVLLNVLVLATFVWPELLTERVKLGCGLAAGGLWLAALVETRGELRRIAARREAEGQLAESQLAVVSAAQQQDDPSAEKQLAGTVTDPQAEQTDALLRKAQEEYLRGDAAAAEKTLLGLLKLDRGDPEAQLLLATLWRQNRRLRDASRALKRLMRQDDAAPWQFEIEREMAILDHQTVKPPTESTEPPRTEQLSEQQFTDQTNILDSTNQAKAA